jgi:hypothetical protein
MSDFDLDALLDGVVLDAALEAGRDPVLAAWQFGAARAIAAAGSTAARPTVGAANLWTAADAAYLARWSGVLGVDELAARLGRTASAVETQQTRRGLPSASKHPEFVTGTQMAVSMGIDEHSVAKLIERGEIRAERVPLSSDRLMWRTRRAAFYAWATNPANWVYFWRSVERPERITDEKLRRLVARRRERWTCADGQPDAWWTPGEVAAYHGVSHIDINRYIRRGWLPAVKWDNWRVLRSEATRPGFRVYRIADGHLARRGTVGLDAFLVLAVAVGIPSPQVARMTGGRISDAGVVTRHRVIVQRGLVPHLARAYALPIQTRGALTWADWRAVSHRFPRLARVWARLAEGRSLSRVERGLLNGVLGAALRFHAPEASPLVGRGDASAARLRRAQVLFEELLGAKTAARPSGERQGE